ncbi:hypothetical protein [Alicyclobacillus acidiphilus]|uniref:hypothetical protein n=1 Tax=Alicyclobacillus acidiphilus TaxID=182455 RepID=UPI0014707024|nr:hypothetical protein [Alicyclobacillus acidiphilus]
MNWLSTVYESIEVTGEITSAIGRLIVNSLERAVFFGMTGRHRREHSTRAAVGTGTYPDIPSACAARIRVDVSGTW